MNAKDSIETSLSMGLFKSEEEAIRRHQAAKLTSFPLAKCAKLENFNPARLQTSAVKAYPLSDRPRGQADIKSVKYWQMQAHIQPIWILQKPRGDSESCKYILIDGAHRIVAAFIKGNPQIPAYVI